MSGATFQNLGFETAGAAPGLAAGWTLGFRATAEEIAGYAPSPEKPQEDFEGGWLGNETFLFALPRTSLEPAFYDQLSLSVENFEAGWSQNESFATELGSIEAADYDAGSGIKLVEDFEALWAGNQGFLFSFAPADLSAGPLDGFESDWRNNQSFLLAFGNSDVSLGPSETFESSWTAMKTV